MTRAVVTDFGSSHVCFGLKSCSAGRVMLVMVRAQAVAQEIRGFEKRLRQLRTQGGIGYDLVERARHAQHPGVALGRANGKGQVTLAQSWRTEAFGVQWRATKPARQKHE